MWGRVRVQHLLEWRRERGNFEAKSQNLVYLLEVSSLPDDNYFRTLFMLNLVVIQ